MGVDISLIIVGALLFFFFIFIIIFSGLEYAYLASNKLTIELKRKQNTRSGNLLGEFFAHPESFWRGTVISFYCCLICFCFLLSKVTIYLINYLPAPIREFEFLQMIVDFIIGSFVVIFSMGFFAKRAFENEPEQKLKSWSGFVYFINKLVAPLASFFVWMSEFILKYLFNVRIKKDQAIFERVNPNKFLRNSIQGQNDDDALNKELFEKALQLTQVKVRKCYVPRNEITALDVNTSVEELKNLFIKTKLSKIIIYDDNIDNVIGYVHHIDLNRHPDSIASILHPIPTVPETMNAIDLIYMFSKERKSIAWVIDEFGGTAGFISIEDVLEEIFGDIRDEYDIEEYVENQLSENEFIFSGRLKLEYLEQKYKLEFGEYHAETLSGYLINKYGTIPKPNDKLIVNRFEAEVLLMSDTKIETVKLKVLYE